MENRANEHREEAEIAEMNAARRRPLRRAGIVAALALGATTLGITAMKMIDDGVLNEGSRIIERAERIALGQPVETITEPPAGANVVLDFYTPEVLGEERKLIARYSPNQSQGERLAALDRICVIGDTRPYAPYTDLIAKLKQISREDGALVIRNRARDMVASLQDKASFDLTPPAIEQRNRETRVKNIGCLEYTLGIDYYDSDGNIVEEGVNHTFEYDPTKPVGERQRAIGTFYNQQKKSKDGALYTGRVRKKGITPELVDYIGRIGEFDEDPCIKLRAAGLLESHRKFEDFTAADPNICASLENK